MVSPLLGFVLSARHGRIGRPALSVSDLATKRWRGFKDFLYLGDDGIPEVEFGECAARQPVGFLSQVGIPVEVVVRALDALSVHRQSRAVESITSSFLDVGGSSAGGLIPVL